MSFDAARAVFNQADANQDGSIDRNEFNQFLGGAGAAGAGFGAGGSSSYESSSFSSSGYGAGAGAAGASGYESAAFAADAGFGAGAGASSFESSSFESSSAGYGAGAGAAYSAGAAFDASAGNVVTQQTAVTQYATDAQGLFRDPNPQIIRRAAAGGVQTYTQNIRIRFLQPPPLPPPGVSFPFDNE